MIGEGACFLFSVLIYDNQISKLNLIKIKLFNYILITRCTVESLNTILIIHSTYKEITFTFIYRRSQSKVMIDEAKAIIQITIVYYVSG